MAETMAPRVPANVVTAARDKPRIESFMKVIAEVLTLLDGAVDENAQSFLLHLGWHEGARLRMRVQGGKGPARSFCQLEAYRAREGWDYCVAKKVDKAVSALVAIDVTVMQQHFAMIPADVKKPHYPSSSEVERLLRDETQSGADAFGLALARMEFKKVPGSFPKKGDYANAADWYQAQAQYWFDHWKRVAACPGPLKQQFTRACADADSVVMLAASRTARNEPRGVASHH